MTPDDIAARRDDATDLLEQLEQRIHALAAAYEQALRERDEAQKLIAEMHDNFARMMRERNKWAGKCGAVHAEVVIVERERDEARAALARLRQEFVELSDAIDLEDEEMRQWADDILDNARKRRARDHRRALRVWNAALSAAYEAVGNAAAPGDGYLLDAIANLLKR